MASPPSTEEGVNPHIRSGATAVLIVFVLQEVWMSLGFGLFLVAVGAILRWGVTRSVEGANLDTIGLILMIIGAIVSVAAFLMSGTFTRTRTRERVETTPGAEERIVETNRRL